jgi:hypothetical protein
MGTTPFDFPHPLLTAITVWHPKRGVDGGDKVDWATTGRLTSFGIRHTPKETHFAVDSTRGLPPARFRHRPPE